MGKTSSMRSISITPPTLAPWILPVGAELQEPMGSGCLINIDVARDREFELQGRAIAFPFFCAFTAMPTSI